ncbi:uncharacterized protein BJ212DRAFT_376724 [Suillus subaureus]|uniref:Uncharacterized protein n=1 Tax=Suillus subaureus TaxID=48587 RepID=A0A9P7E8C1_9AGAM|nr:uncharacterized protein BJ212DRAFT_376724 [Suillus subaureus]KAG1813837.1 hypothetical protein BJ212DRAFT_376724 [Suillus subaureus]
MATLSSDVLRKFARLFAQLLKSSLRRACYTLRIFYALLRRLGSMRVRFCNDTHFAGTLQEELRPAICGSGLPAIHLPPTDVNWPGGRPHRTLAVPADIAYPQHPLYMTPPSHLSSRDSFSTGTVSDVQVSNANVDSGQARVFLETNTSTGEPQFVFLRHAEPPEYIALLSIIPNDVKRYDRKIKMKWVEPNHIVITPTDSKYVEYVFTNSFCVLSSS